MQEHIRVRVTFQALWKRDRYPAEEQWKAFGQAVQIKTDTDAKQLYRPLLIRASAKRRSMGWVILMLAGLPATAQIFSPNSSNR